MRKDNWRDSTKNSVSEKQLADYSHYDKQAEDLFPLLIPEFLT